MIHIINQNIKAHTIPCCEINLEIGYSYEGSFEVGRSGRIRVATENKQCYVVVAPNTICWANWKIEEGPKVLTAKTESDPFVVISVPEGCVLFAFDGNVDFCIIRHSSSEIETMPFVRLDFDHSEEFSAIGLKFENGKYEPFIDGDLYEVDTRIPSPLDEPYDPDRRLFELPKEVLED